METKATTSATGFRATVGSLEQLDLSIRSPIYLAATRLAASDTGSTLPQRVAQLRASLTTCSGQATQSFESFCSAQAILTRSLTGIRGV
ncbi:PD-(D/E)XK motif protein [Pseudoroseomonas cervicalis]|uniref:PD-(D/E)XK motif protein n=1 Tax=Teichococcus cervicalis TaxID=204525 RepID=UPI0035EB8B6E